MEAFLKELVEGEQFELTIDTKIFEKDIILKAAYNFLDRWYFFFSHDADQNIVLRFTKKQDVSLDPKIVIGEFSDELLDVYLRNKLEIDNKVIREAIVTKAINGPLDMNNFVSLNTENNEEQNEIDFDQDIDEILKEIENDPDLNIDEEEIDKILKEIEEDVPSWDDKPTISVDPSSISDVKKMFKDKK